MKKETYQRLVAAGLALFMTALMVALSSSAITYARAHRDRSLVEAELERLVRRTPYPSEINLQALEDERDALAFMLSELEGSVGSAPRWDGEPDAAVFSARAQAAIERFQVRIEELGIGVPADLEVGFAAYASGGAVPDIRHVPRLMGQLDAIERILDVLLEAGVSSIDALERNRFEFAAPSGRKRDALASESDGVRVRVGFTANEASVWRALALYAQPARLLEVVEFSHRTQSDILNVNLSEKRFSKLELSEDHMFEGAAALSRSERMVAGDEPVRVELVLVAHRIHGDAP